MLWWQSTVSVYWEVVNFDPYRIKTLESIAKKFGIVDYICETSLHTKFGENPLLGDFWAYMERNVL